MPLDKHGYLIRLCCLSDDAEHAADGANGDWTCFSSGRDCRRI